MLSIDDFRKQSAQEFGEDDLDAIDSEYSVYLLPEQPVKDLPALRVRIWPRSTAACQHPNWTWNWRIAHPGPKIVPQDSSPEIQMILVDGKTEDGKLFASIAEAAKAAIASINHYLEIEMPAQRELEEQRSLAQREQRDGIKEQVNDFLAK